MLYSKIWLKFLTFFTLTVGCIICSALVTGFPPLDSNGQQPTTLPKKSDKKLDSLELEALKFVGNVDSLSKKVSSVEPVIQNNAQDVKEIKSLVNKLIRQSRVVYTQKKSKTQRAPESESFATIKPQDDNTRIWIAPTYSGTPIRDTMTEKEKKAYNGPLGGWHPFKNWKLFKKKK